MRSWLVLGIIALQVLVLGQMVFGREQVVRHGTRVFIQSLPIDPRDPFRGDYVRLRYPMNDSDNFNVLWDSDDYTPKRDDRVYGLLDLTGDDLYTVRQISNEKPDEGFFIRGRIDRVSRQDSNQVRVRYGIEQLFVEQGKGDAIEDRQGVGRTQQLALETEVAIGDNGTAVIVGYRWARLSVGIDMNRNAVEGGDSDSPAIITLSLANESEETVVLPLAANGCSFTLESMSGLPKVNRTDNDFMETATPPCDNVVASDVVVLNPGEQHDFVFDLADPRWHFRVQRDGITVTGDIQALDLFTSYRFVYDMPTEIRGELLNAADQSSASQNRELARRTIVSPEFYP